MDLELKGKNVLVAAGSRGIGRAVAEAFLQEGATVTICAREAAILERARTEMGKWGAVRTVSADVTRAADIETAVRQAAVNGRLDALFVNAGGPPAGKFEDFDDSAWQRAFELNLLSSVRLVRAALPFMKATGGGAIVQLMSFVVKEPGLWVGNLILSNAIRAGAVGLAKTLARELAPFAIRVNTVLPGRIDTERSRGLDAGRAQREGRSREELHAEQARQVPLGRYGRPEEVAAMIVFLASPRASYITGATVQVDGGLVASLL